MMEQIENIPLSKTRVVRRIQAFIRKYYWAVLFASVLLFYATVQIIMQISRTFERSGLKRPPGLNHLFEIVHPSQRPSQENAVFKYPDVLYKSDCISRDDYSKEFYRMFGYDPYLINISRPRYLVLGSDSAIGKAVTKKLRKSREPMIAVENKYALSFSSDHPFIKTMSLKGIILIGDYQYTKYHNNTNYASVTRLTANHFKSIASFASDRKIPTVAVFPPPHSPNQASLLSWLSATVIFAPYFVDNSGTYDYSNPLSLAASECAVHQKANVVSIRNLPVHMMTPGQIADLILERARFQKGEIIAIGSNETVSLEKAVKVAFPQCEVTINELDFNVGETPPSTVELKGSHQLLHTMQDITFEPHETLYLSIVAHAGNNTDILRQFLSHLQLTDQMELVLIDAHNIISKIHVPKHLFSHVKVVQTSEDNHFRALNIGIRRSAGDYVLVTRCNVFFPQTFYDIVAQRRFNPMVVYRSFLVVGNTTAEDLLTAINPNKFDQPASSSSAANAWAIISSQRSFEENASPEGALDFLLCSQLLWTAVEGFTEYSSATDTEALVLAKFMRFLPGYVQSFLPKPVGRFETELGDQPPPLENAANLQRELICSGTTQLSLSDSSGWGLPEVELPIVIY